MKEINFRAEHNGRVYNVASRLPKIIRHPRYRGWHKTQGYIMRLVTEHPYSNKRGYVPEHRLVMEQYLGRFLGPNEKIHHRDQNRENNDFDNLELFGGQAKHASDHLRGKRNNHGQFIAIEPIFSELKFRLFNKNTKTTYIYSLAALIGKTFRKGQFEFRGRFTGLEDKNGREIYEGDILEDDEGEIVKIKYGNGVFYTSLIRVGFTGIDTDEGLNCLSHQILDLTSRVIGNIYENPDLIPKHLP